MDVAKKDMGVSLSDFLELIAVPCSQPTMAGLIDRLFGYSLSGSYAATEVTSAIGERIPLPDLYDRIQKDGTRQASLLRAVRSLRQ